MTYILLTILGSVVTTLTLLFTYEYAGYDPMILVWITIYTIGLYVLSYGINRIKLYMQVQQ